MVGNLTSGLLPRINIDFSKRLLNEACGVLLLFVRRFQDHFSLKFVNMFFN